MRLELVASEFISLRYNHSPTLQYNTRLIAYTVFVLCSSICTIGNTRKVVKYNELIQRKLFRPWNLFISTGLIHVSWKKYTNICCIREKINKIKPALIVAGNEGADETEQNLTTALRCYLLDTCTQWNIRPNIKCQAHSIALRMALSICEKY